MIDLLELCDFPVEIVSGEHVERLIRFNGLNGKALINSLLIGGLNSIVVETIPISLNDRVQSSRFCVVGGSVPKNPFTEFIRMGNDAVTYCGLRFLPIFTIGSLKIQHRIQFLFGGEHVLPRRGHAVCKSDHLSVCAVTHAQIVSLADKPRLLCGALCGGCQICDLLPIRLFSLVKKIETFTQLGEQRIGSCFLFLIRCKISKILTENVVTDVMNCRIGELLTKLPHPNHFA